MDRRARWTAIASGLVVLGCGPLRPESTSGDASSEVTTGDGTAEALSGLVLAQLLEPGRPCVFNLGFAHVLDMSSTVALTGAAENALLQVAGSELARFHGLTVFPM